MSGVGGDRIIWRMAALRIDVAESVQSRLMARATENGFETVEAYIGAMLVAEAAGPGVNDEELEAMLLGRWEGPFVDMDDADFRQIRTKFEKRLKGAQGGDVGRGK